MPPVDVVIDDVLIAIGAALMVVNIRRYLQFMGRSRNILEEDSHLMLWRNAGLCLLVFFLIGYVVSIFYTSSGIVLALVLFFGSVYVFAALSLMMKLVDTSQRMMSSAVDEAREVDAKTGLLNSKGFASAARLGSENNDAFAVEDGRIVTQTNHCGGILGGITDGMPLVFRAAVKPTPSIALPQQSVRLSTLEPDTLLIHGRHDPCIVPRAVPVMEAAAALAVYDAILQRRKERN